MARLVTAGFEWSDTKGEASSGINGTFVASPVRTGVSSLQPSGPCTWSLSTSLGTTYYLRTYVYQDGAIPPGGTALCFMRDASLNVLGGLILNADSSLQLAYGASTQVGSNSAPLAINTWTRLELSVTIGTGSVDSIEGRIDGVSFASGSSLAISDTAISSVAVNTGGIDAHVWHDDVAINDSTGAAQNSWPGDGRIVLLRPTADSAVGTGWTLGNTTATGGNAWSRLNKAPPDSAADLTTAADADQIRNATSNANVNYDATMTTYTAAGMGVSDTVNVIVPIIATGSPVVTSAKAGTVGVVSNPAIANISLGAGGTSGAFWSGVAIGTYPTGNKWSFGTTTYAPTVTLGTAPVMRVTQVTSSTRIAIVTEMGIYVDYTPAVTTLPPLPVYVDSAVARSTNY